MRSTYYVAGFDISGALSVTQVLIQTAPPICSVCPFVLCHGQEICLVLAPSTILESLHTYLLYERTVMASYWEWESRNHWSSGFSLPLVVAFFAATLLGWRLWKFTLVPIIWPDDPKVLPYWIPLIGEYLVCLDHLQNH